MEFDVLLVGYYGFGNLGDELLAESAISLLQSAGIPRGRIAMLSAVPQQTSIRLGIKAFNRWKITEVYGALKKSRSMLLGGGGLFQDSTSVKSCLYYWGITVIAKICGARPWAVGQSIGPLRSVLAQWLAKNAFASCLYRGVRDSKSLTWLHARGLSGEQSPDLVMGIEVKPVSEHGSVLLLNLRSGYGAMAENAAREAQSFAVQNQLLIRGIALAKEDEALLWEFKLKNILKLDELVLAETLEDFENAAIGSTYAIGMRLHFLILSLLAGLKCCAVPYDPKVNSLALEYNIPMVDLSGAGIAFSEAWRGAWSGGAREKLSEIFRRAVAAVSGEV